MYLSHLGLKEKYEVSCDELDTLVDIAKNSGAVTGARMMGGGFGGSTINLVKKTNIPVFIEAVLENYKTPEGKAPAIIQAGIENGTEITGID